MTCHSVLSLPSSLSSADLKQFLFFFYTPQALQGHIEICSLKATLMGECRQEDQSHEFPTLELLFICQNSCPRPGPKMVCFPKLQRSVPQMPQFLIFKTFQNQKPHQPPTLLQPRKNVMLHVTSSNRMFLEHEIWPRTQRLGPPSSPCRCCSRFS